MVKKHIIKISNKITKLKHRLGPKKRLGIAATSAILILGATWWLALPLPQNQETEIPARAGSYVAEIISCRHSQNEGTKIEIKFRGLEPALSALPEYQIEEISAEAKTRIIFDRVARVNGNFDYQEIAASPLIDAIDYNVDNNRMVMEISRKGSYLPAQTAADNSVVAVILAPATENYPVISNQKPAGDSTVFPMRHTISFEAVLKDSLKSAAVFFENRPIQFRSERLAPNEYRFAFEQDIEIDKEYAIKAIVADKENRTSVSVWSFSGQIPSAAILGEDRFKYLGWWGQLNADGVNVRKGVAITSDRLGTLSRANRVKVIEEVYGEWVNGKNLWYKIDGGAYAGAYIFSDFVTPMEQPKPPKDFVVPKEVEAGENWIDVDLAKKVLTLFAYDKPMFITYISPGREENPTKTGIYRIWYKVAKDEMQGGPPLHTYRYHLKNIPWVMYYNYDYAIHGTYWHDKFGMPQSAGCTNMTQGDAKFIFENTLPELPDGQEEVFAREKPNSGHGTGTVVHNHE